MKKLEKSRTLILFEESIKSKATLRYYKLYLDRFLKWSNKDYESLLVLTSDELDILLQDYMMYLKKKLSPNSIKLHFASINKFLLVGDKEYNYKKLKMLFPEEVKPQGGRAWTTEEISKMLEYADTQRSKAIVHTLASTGCRIGALPELRMRHLYEIDNDCLALTFYEGSKWEYISFTHHEATKSLRNYFEDRKNKGEKITDESFAFRPVYFLNSSPSKPINEKTITSLISYLVKKCGIVRNSKNGIRYDVASAMGFRKRFNTILKSNPKISYAIAERLMDHRTNLEAHYLDTPKEKLFEEYKKAMPDLLVNDSSRDKERIQKLESENNSQRELKMQIAMLKDENRTLNDELHELGDKFDNISKNIGDEILRVMKEEQKKEENENDVFFE